MHDCLISFGSNLGDGFGLLERAVDYLRASKGITELRVSPSIRTPPVGGPPGQSDYVNAAIRLQTVLSAAALHQRLLAAEAELGRVRRGRWGSRTVDLDLLLYGELQIVTDSLTVPHPRMSYRRFVLQPAVPIAAEMKHPVCGCRLGHLLECLERKPNRILLVNNVLSAEMAWGEALSASIEHPGAKVVFGELPHPEKYDEGLWHILQVDPAQANDWLGSSKLLVERKGGDTVPNSKYCGPRLLVEGFDEAILKAELGAAVQAMVPIKIDSG